MTRSAASADELEATKRAAARRAWPMRYEMTPSARREGRRTTWGEWFERRFGQPLEAYAAEIKLRDQVREELRNAVRQG